jgi:hypothetical protein
VKLQEAKRIRPTFCSFEVSLSTRAFKKYLKVSQKIAMYLDNQLLIVVPIVTDPI